MDDREQRIRDRAYAIWQREGRPEGQEREHWQQAMREIDGEAGRAGAPAGGGDMGATGEAPSGSPGKSPSRKKAGTAGEKGSPKEKPAAAAKAKPAAATREKPAARPRKKKDDT
jgi:hypothetical protein